MSLISRFKFLGEKVRRTKLGSNAQTLLRGGLVPWLAFPLRQYPTGEAQWPKANPRSCYGRTQTSRYQAAINYRIQGSRPHTAARGGFRPALQAPAASLGASGCSQSETDVITVNSKVSYTPLPLVPKTFEIAMRVKPKQQRWTGLTLRSKSCHFPRLSFPDLPSLPNGTVVRFSVRNRYSVNVCKMVEDLTWINGHYVWEIIRQK